MHVILRHAILSAALSVMLVGCTRNISRHEAYQPLLDQHATLSREMHLWRQSSTLIHPNRPPYKLESFGSPSEQEDYVGPVPAGTELRIEKFERRTWLIGIPMDFAIVQLLLPETSNWVRADIRLAIPSITEGGQPSYPWTLLDHVVDDRR